MRRFYLKFTSLVYISPKMIILPHVNRQSRTRLDAHEMAGDRYRHYQRFNPVQFTGRQLPSLADLKEELTGIYENVDQSLHQILKDESLLANKDILSDSEQQLLQRFNSGAEELSTMNAERLVEIASKLHQGVNKIFITPDELRQRLNRPMTPEDAVKTFRHYINELTAGSNGAE